MVGKVSSATEFSTKIVPSETDISSSVAPVIGPTAAMALPPQIAVPVEMRNAGRDGTEISLPSSVPTSMAKAILRAVYRNPLRPACTTSCRFIPKPSPTTADCSKTRESFRDSSL